MTDCKILSTFSVLNGLSESNLYVFMYLATWEKKILCFILANIYVYNVYTFNYFIFLRRFLYINSLDLSFSVKQVSWNMYRLPLNETCQKHLPKCNHFGLGCHSCSSCFSMTLVKRLLKKNLIAIFVEIL